MSSIYIVTDQVCSINNNIIQGALHLNSTPKSSILIHWHWTYLKRTHFMMNLLYANLTCTHITALTNIISEINKSLVNWQTTGNIWQLKVLGKNSGFWNSPPHCLEFSHHIFALEMRYREINVVELFIVKQRILKNTQLPLSLDPSSVLVPAL